MTRLLCAILCALALSLGSVGCGKIERAEVTKHIAAAPTTRQTTSQEPTKAPLTAKEPTVKGPAVLTLRATGALIDADGKPFASPDDAEAFLKTELAQLKEPRTVFRAEKQADIFHICNALTLYRKAGFREVELQEAGGSAGKGPILTLAEPAKKAGNPDKPGDDDLKLRPQMVVIVHANGSGSQAGQVRDLIFKSITGETGLPRGKWRDGLAKAIRALVDGQNLANDDDCEIQADPKLTYGAVLEVLEVCSSAGLKRFRLSLLAGKQPEE